MGSNEEHSQAAVSAAFFPIPIDSLDAPSLELDLYLRHNRGVPVLYRAKGSAYSVRDCKKLAEQGVTHLLVPTTQHRVFQKLMTERVSTAYEDPNLSRAERTRIVRESCATMISDLMTYPNIPGISETLGDMAGCFAAWCTEDESKFSYLLDMSEHDYYTITHMVNVGVGCGMLAAELGMPTEQIQRIVQGGLVHDVGKTGVPAEVLNKEGKLTDDEWAMIRRHPEIGAEILQANGETSPEALEMTIAHHERLDGSGYPHGLRGDAMGMPARICAVVDVYDAMTAARPYRGPLPPNKVLDMLRADRGKGFDESIFDAWDRVVQRLVEQDPSRAVQDTGQPAPPLSILRQMPDAAGSTDQTALAAGEVRGVFVRRSMRTGPGVGDPIRCRLMSTEATAVRLALPCPAASGEMLRITLPDEGTLNLTVTRTSYGPAGEPIVECARAA